jgi:hypothetical protein
MSAANAGGDRVADTVLVVGGLYGNLQALSTIEHMAQVNSMLLYIFRDFSSIDRSIDRHHLSIYLSM